MKQKGFQCKCIPRVCFLPSWMLRARLCCTRLSYALVNLALSVFTVSCFTCGIAWPRRLAEIVAMKGPHVLLMIGQFRTDMTDKAVAGQLEDAVGMVEEVQCKCKWLSEDRIWSFEPSCCTNAPCMVLSYDVSGPAKMGELWQRGKADSRIQQISTWSAWSVASMKRHIANYESMIKVFRYRQKWEKTPF